MHWVGLCYQIEWKKCHVKGRNKADIQNILHFPFNIWSLYTPTQSQVRWTTGNFIHRKIWQGEGRHQRIRIFIQHYASWTSVQLWSWLKSMKSWVSIYDQQQWFLIWYVVQGLYRRCLSYPSRQLVKWMRTHFYRWEQWKQILLCLFLFLALVLVCTGGNTQKILLLPADRFSHPWREGTPRVSLKKKKDGLHCSRSALPSPSCR